MPTPYDAFPVKMANFPKMLRECGHLRMGFLRAFARRPSRVFGSPLMAGRRADLPIIPGKWLGVSSQAHWHRAADEGTVAAGPRI